MNKPKHTPGPWAVLATSRRDFGAVTHVGPDDTAAGVCEVYGSTDEEPKANAALIAASPELLECLTEAIGYLSDYDFVPWSATDKWVNAVKKAGGELK